jgi:hypothetical protein
MSEFWQNLGAAVGIGAATVVVASRTPVVGWGEEATGTVLLTGGEVAQRVKLLSASLMEHWTTTTMVGKTVVTVHHYQAHDTMILASEIEISRGATLNFEYSLTAPWYQEFDHQWFIGAKAEIPAAVDRGGQANFVLTAPPDLRNLAAVLTEVSRIQVRSWHLCAGGVARAELIARDQARTELDGVRVEVKLVEGRLVGQVVVNPQEKNAMDVLKSLVQADRLAAPFNLAVNDTDAATEAFEAALRPHVDALRMMPIPSADATGDVGSLPVAAESPNDSA